MQILVRRDKTTDNAGEKWRAIDLVADGKELALVLVSGKKPRVMVIIGKRTATFASIDKALGHYSEPRVVAALRWVQTQLVAAAHLAQPQT